MKKVLCVFLLFLFSFFYFNHKVYAVEWVVCPIEGAGCSHVGGDGIQQAIDEAKNGDIITIRAGSYTRSTPTKTNYLNQKFNGCVIDMKGRKITLRGQGGVIIDVNNKHDGYVGICNVEGEITIENMTIRQTLRPAIYLIDSKAIIKNVTFLDIDSTAIEVRSSQVMILNSLFAGSAGPGIQINDQSYARIENNTFFGNGGAGIIFNLCDNHEPTGDIANNLIVNPGDLFSKALSGSGIGAECREQEQKVTKIQTSNNFVWKGQSVDGCLKGPDKKSSYDDCASGEICTGTTVAYPQFVGADDQGTVCVYGEGTIVGDFNTRPNSVVTQAGAGYGAGPCVNGNSNVCATYIQSKPLPQPSAPPEPPPESGPGPGPGSQPPGPQGNIFPQIINPYNLPEIFGTLINLPNNIIYTQEKTTKASSSGIGMDLMVYIAFSAVYIMFIHFAVGIKSEFSILWMIGYFVLGGVIGGWLNTYEGGFVFSIIMSLLFF